MSRFGFTPRKGTGDGGFLSRLFSRSRSRNARRHRDERRGRTLAIDPLESRCLLSVTPADLSAIIVNQTYGSAQSTNTAHSVAVDNAGDFVVTWTSTGSYTDSAGTTYPVTNVEARYYTNTVDQVNLPTSLLTTSGTKQSYFSLRYNDQTIEQISVTGEAQSPLGDPTAPATTNISGTFELFYNATGNDTQGQLDPTVTGGTQSDLLTVDYNEVATYAGTVEIAGPAVAAEQIQQWLNAFAPQAANPATGFAGSDAIHATVNATDAHTFVLDYGQATEGLDQSSLLQYVSTEATSAVQDLSFTSTAGSTTTFPLPLPGAPEVPVVTPIVPPAANIVLQVGTVQTAPFSLDVANPANTATAMQTALQNAGFAGATVTGTSAASPYVFTVDFTTPEPPIQYVVPTTDFLAPEVSFSNDADVNSLSGFLPSVAISTLDKPFTINNIPFSQTNPALTAEAMAGAFQAQVDSFSTGVAPYNFISLSPQTPNNVTLSTVVQDPYTAPVYNDVGAPTASDEPVTGWNPTISVTPVVQINTGTTDTNSFTQFQVTFTSSTGTIVDAPLVVTSFTTANGGTIAGPTTNLDGTVAVPVTVSGATVTVVKQSGNEFQVNPPQSTSVYTANQAPLSATQPAVAMDGSGEFVITWAGEVSQELAPKDFTDVYARVYAPVGVTPAGTAVLGAVSSDLYQQQELTFDFTGAVPTGNTDQFELSIGSFTTAPIVFNTDPATTAANIENALLSQYPGISVSANSTGNPYNIEVTFDEGGAAEPPIQYVADPTIPLPTSMSFAAAPEQSFTGVQLVTNPTQALTFDFTAGAPTATGNLGTFQLQIGSFTTAPISFNSSPTVTALNMQNALRNAGFAGVAVSAQGLVSTSPSFFTFDITFSGYDIPPAQYLAIAPASGGLPASVTMSNGDSGLPVTVQAAGVGDPYTIQVNANYTNPQFQPAVAMDAYGNFVVVWANQGPDESYFNDVTMQCFDNDGNPLGNALVVDEDPANPSLNYNTDTNYDPGVAMQFNSIGSDDIAVTWTTAVELPSQVATNPIGTVFARVYDYNPEQKLGPYSLINQVSIANNGGLSSISMDGQDNFYLAWQQQSDEDVIQGPNAAGVNVEQNSTGVYAAEYQVETSLFTVNPVTFNNPLLYYQTANQQTVSFTVPSTPDTGTFFLSIPGYSTAGFGNEGSGPGFTTGPIGFNTANPAGMAANMQAAIQQAGGTAGNYAATNARVTTASAPNNNNDTYSFTITFGAIGPVYPTIPAQVPPVSLASTATAVRPTFRVSSSSDAALPPDQSQTFWPFNQEAAQIQTTISGDIVTSYQGYGPQASDDISVPSSFFDSDFAQEQQQLTFNFVGGVPAFNSSNDQFELLVGSTLTGPITFNTSAATTAANIQAALQSTLAGLGFEAPAGGFGGTPTATVTGTLSGNVYTFKVTFGIGPNEPQLELANDLPGTVTFSNSVAAPAAAQQLTFTPATVPVMGVFELQEGAQTTAPIYFDSTNPTNTAASIQTALVNLGFAGTTVTVDPASTTTSFIFDVTFGAAEAPLQLVAAPALPSAVVYSAAITTQWNNADLLAYFDPYTNGAGNPIVGEDSPSTVPTAGYLATLYEDMIASTRGGVAIDENDTVTTAIDQVLFDSEYEPPEGVAAATQTQLSRLDAILEDVAGLLRGEGNGVMTSQWDANATDSTNSTYSDNLVSTQRQGEEQRYYLVVPYDVQQGTFSLGLEVAPLTVSPNDVATSTGVTTIYTGAINMPSINFAEPGEPINAQTTANNITAAIDKLLGYGNSTEFVGGNAAVHYGDGSVYVRTVSIGEIDARQGTDFAVPTAVTKAMTPVNFPTKVVSVSGVTAVTQQAAAPLNANNAVVYELTFEGQVHDVPVDMFIRGGSVNDLQWIGSRTITPGTPPAKPTISAETFATGGASAPVVVPGDYTGSPGTEQYNAALGVTAAGNQVVAYTDEELQTDQATPVDDSSGNLESNVYYNQLDESTDIAGPHIVSWTDGNGVDLLNAPKSSAVGVNSKYLVLTFDEPMLADNPATDPDSVYNTANYQIYDSNGNLLSNVITHVDYGLSEVSQVAGQYGFTNINSSSAIPDNKWEVVLTIDDSSTATGELPNGTYTLKVLAAEHATTGGQTGLCNIYGTPLDLTGFNQPTSQPFVATVTINSSTNPGQEPIPPGTTQTDPPINAAPYAGGEQLDPSASSTNDSGDTALNGNYVVVWSSTIGGQSNIIGQMYKSSGVQIGGEFVVNTAASTNWSTPAVAMDAAGDFIVVWAGQTTGSTSPDIADIYGRAYNATGQALTSQFLVSQFVTGVQTAGLQDEPSVAMSPDGTFVVAWASTPNYAGLSNTTSYNTAIFAREYDYGDVPIGNEFQVTPLSSIASTNPNVAIDAHDNFVIAWEGDFQSSSAWGVYGDYFTAKSSGAAALPTAWTSTGPKLLNQTPNSRGSFPISTSFGLHDTGPRVAMIPSVGTGPSGFVVTWADYVSGNFSIFAQQFGPNGTANSTGALNTASTIMVNPPQSTTGAGWQYMPAVGVDPEGDIAIAWTTYGQDNANNSISGVLDYGIYMTIYYSSTSGKGLAGTNSGEFRVNATTLGNQVAPTVAFNDFENDALVAWVGPATSATTSNATAIFDRDIDPPNTPPSVLVPNTPKVSAVNTTVAVGTSAAQATFTVTLSAPTTKAVTVKYATGNGTATAGVNYTATSGTITFAPMQTTVTVPVNVAGLPAGGAANTSFTLNLTSPSGNATLGQAAATGTITDAAPTITLSPVSQSYLLGNSVTFKAAASGTPKPTVQWQVSVNGGTWTNIAGATKPAYTFLPTAAMSGDEYHAVFTNAGGSVATAPATLTLDSPPVVTNNPIGKVVDAGATVALSVAASGTPTPTVQWQTSTDGVNWTNISGATSTTYSFTAAGSMSGSQFHAVFTNSIGTATTNPATLTVYSPPTITTNPVSQSAAVGSQVSFTAAAAGTPAPAVQWQLSTNGTTWSNISGATSTSYTVTVAATMSGYQYQAVFVNSHGLLSVTTAATLTVKSPPVVKTSPASQSVTAGATVTFTAAATGTPAPTVQWQSSANGTTWSNIAGAISSTYSFTATTAASGTQYRAVYTNSLGTATTTAAKISVNAAPAVTANPTSQSVLAGATVAFSAAATGATSQQWQLSTNFGTTWSSISGAVGATYSVKTTVAMSGYMYRVAFTNAYGSTHTAAATLTVSVAPVVTLNPTSKAVTAGLPAAFTAAASGTPAPTVQWQTSTNGTTWTNISGATSTTYSVTATGAMTGSQYRALFVNSASTVATAAAKLTVNWAPAIVSAPAAQSVSAGKPVSFTASASGSPAPTVQWQLSINGSIWGNITGATAATYTFTAASSQSGYLYRAVFTNSLGSVTTVAAKLTVTTVAAKIVTVQAGSVIAAEMNLDNANSLSNQNSLSAAAVDAVLARRL
jgi:hypothetical protein